MRQITFEDIYKLGNMVIENTRYRHFHYPEMLVRYDSNFIEFKELPSLTEFKSAEEYLRDYHLRKGQKHVKFYFPENQKPTEEIIAYLTDMGYEIGFLELYAIQPKHFPKVKNNPAIDIQVVTEKTWKYTLSYNTKMI
ncbi:DUF5613 domain-containing protein [Oceanobacillus sp. J11TS1]|uniref:DUF5613 domain-containing protein n=1 Tax=Oceanobacillus sp. J11TS1 TaxID=2807191 RepID=UPI001B02B775|nr:DUF5613 domain-containing protein [Oceanobacillus sp. J11TS1]GIO24031.1 hypothetical protein J11TS1_26120 [Oceanobacillus sp. J11TS1]